MKFIDEIDIAIYSGSGGRGCISFRRERFISKGGPDGGDGGDGGNIIFRVSAQIKTLQHLRFNNQFRAGNGGDGKGCKKKGKVGIDLFIDLPVGTLVIDATTNHVIYDLIDAGCFFIILEGGKGGFGNSKFRSSVNRTPRFAQAGTPGSMLRLKLELKLLADVGIIGMPNVGKSSLLNYISSAKSKIGDYFFTTLIPNLGVVNIKNISPFIVADIPGLIEGSHDGCGLGIQFLKHIERTSIIVHLIDINCVDFDNPFACIKMIDNELASYSFNLANKEKILVFNKIDTLTRDKEIKVLKNIFKLANIDCIYVSALTGQGIYDFLVKVSDTLTKCKKY